jgi:pimeloyl-ACP methyl ester carboxylesterase
VEIKASTVWANGLEFGLLEAGGGPLALCLHGFPDTARTWRYLLPELAAAGFRAVAPFMRGYAPTAVPSDGRYSVGALDLVRDAERYLCPDSAMKVIQGAGHFPHLEQPAEVNQHILAWVTG